MSAQAAEEPQLWIRGATLVDVSAGESAHAVDVVVSGERIAAVTRAGLMEPPEGSRVIEAEGLWLAPGAFDAHVHVSGVPGMVAFDTAEKEELRDLYRAQVGKSYLLHGFTQVVDLNHVSEAAVAFLDEAGPAPDFLHVGTGLTMAGGYPLVFAPEEERWAYPNFLLDPVALPESLPEEIDPSRHTPEAAVTRVVEAGGKGVKVFWEKGFGGFTDLPTPSREMLDRIAELAHGEGLPVVVHGNAFPAWDFVIGSPVDALVHGMWNWKEHDGAPGLPAEVSAVVDRAVLQGVALMPTTRVIGGLRDLYDPAFLEDERLARVYPPGFLQWLRGGGGGELKEQIREEDFGGLPDDGRIRSIMEGVRDQGDRVLVAFVQRGGKLVFGSDTPSAPIHTNPPGLNGRLELERYEALGLDPVTVARSLTTEPAALFGVAGDYGEVAVGRKANLLLLEADPLNSIDAWGRIQLVIFGGQPLERDELRADR